MTQDRIQINGVWYVREDKQEPIELDLTEFVGVVYEDDKYCWEATKIYEDDGKTLYDGVDIKFTDKRIKPWKEEHWDNTNWFIGVHGGNEESMVDARRSMCDEGIRTFQAFVGVLIEKEWL